MFKSADVKKLSSQLRPLVFSPEQDAANIKPALVQQYLDHYKINFSKSLPNVRHGFGKFEAGGVTIAAHYWLPEMARATIFVLHGYLDHVGLFNHLIRFSLQNDYAVVAYDLPGMGLSSGERASIDSFQRYHEVLEACLQKSKLLMPQPWYCVAQSTGAVAVLQHIQNATPCAFRRVVLLAPLVRSIHWSRDRWVYAIGRFFLRNIPRVYTDNSHDEIFLQFVRKDDPLQSGKIPLRWVGAMKEWIEKVKTFSPKPAEVLIVQGDGDGTVDWEYNLKEIQRILPKVTVKIVPGGRHHLGGESAPYRAQVFAALKAYIEKDNFKLEEGKR